MNHYLRITRRTILALMISGLQISLYGCSKFTERFSCRSHQELFNVFQRSRNSGQEAVIIVEIIKDYVGEELLPQDIFKTGQDGPRRSCMLWCCVVPAAGLTMILPLLTLPILFERNCSIIHPQKPVCLLNSHDRCADYNAGRMHATFLCSTLTTAGWSALNWLGCCHYLSSQIRKKDAYYALERFGKTCAETFGRSLKNCGVVCVTAGSPLLPMGISWSAGHYIGPLVAEQRCQSPPKPDDTITKHTYTAKCMFLTGLTLTTAGTALWILGQKIVKHTQKYRVPSQRPLLEGTHRIVHVQEK